MNIEICKTCGGIGTVCRDVGTHQSEYEYITCNSCNGTGRIKTGSYNYRVPFDTSDDVINRTDTEVVNLLRKLEKR